MDYFQCYLSIYVWRFRACRHRGRGLRSSLRLQLWTVQGFTVRTL